MIPERFRILFSEDDPDTREMTFILLDGEGFDVVCAECPEDALELARLERFDAYVLDNCRPGISGLDLCQEIREFDSTTPIIIYSAPAFDDDKPRALANCAQAYVTKPTGVEQLGAVIRSAIIQQEKENSASLVT